MKTVDGLRVCGKILTASFFVEVVSEFWFGWLRKISNASFYECIEEPYVSLKAD